MVQLNRPDEAMRFLEVALGADKVDLFALYTMGEALERRGSFADALAYAQRALSIRPEFPEATALVGSLLLETNKPKEARLVVEPALRAHPENPQLHNAFGLVLLAEDEPKDAESQFRQAILFWPDYEDAQVNHAVSLTLQHREIEALPGFEMVLRANPRWAERSGDFGFFGGGAGLFGGGSVRSELIPSALTRERDEGVRLPDRKRALESEEAVQSTRKEIGLTGNVELLKRLYDRFNARDIEAVLTALHEDVIWANGMEGGHVLGREEVRSYWKRQWAMVDPRVEPVAFAEGPSAEVMVEVHQVVRDLKGNLLADKMVGHIFRVDKGLVTRFDIRGA